MSYANDLDASGAEQSPPPWQDVARALGEATERSPKQRATYLDQIEDEAVREEVRALLTHEAAADRLLGASAVDLAGPHLDDLLRSAAQSNGGHPPADDLAGRSVGPYEVLREIARGGMGRVFLARREDVGTLVALKVLNRAAGASSRRLTLFRREQRLLARLDHPGIARFLDARLLEESGVPYVVMEHVDGLPLDRYCREQDVPLRGRLRVLVDVCDAVGAAHRKLVVHRDLKPSNVLVEAPGGSEEDAAPQVKIVDFGIGALLPEASTSPAMREEPGGSASGAATRRLTWEYASPEQVRGEDASTSMDVYALGALLYTLVAGRPPFEADGHSAAETKRQVLEDIPPVPSKALEDSASGASAPGFAEERFASEDLNAIALRALRKDSSERYGTADELATDVRRFLGGYPVRARTASATSPAGSLFYRGAKFVRRNAAAVLAASLAALLLLATAGIAFYQADRASEQAHRARAAQSFITGLFEDADPLEGEAGTVSASTLLERGAERVGRRFEDAPEVRAELRRVLGTAYRSTGHPQQASKQLERALRTERSLHGDDPREHTADALDGLARLRVEQGRFVAADSLHRAALGMRRQLFGGASRQVATSLEGLARVAREQGDLGRADSLAREALRAQEALIASAGGDTSQVTSADASAAEALATLATTKGTLANVLARQGRYDEALPYMREVLALRRRAVGETHPRVATAMNNLAFVLGAQGDLAEAEKLRRQALRVHGEALGTEHPRYASDLSNLAVLKYRQGRYEAADSLLQRALQVERAHYGKGHPSLAYTLQNLAGVAKAQGATREAARRYRQALKIRRDTLGEQHPRTLLTLGSLAGVLRQQGKTDQAADTLRKAIRLQREVLGNKHPELAGNLFKLGEILSEQGRCREALPLYRESTRIQQEARGKRHPKTALFESSLGACLTSLGRYEEAEPLLLEAHDVLTGQDTRDAYVVKTRKHLRELYQAWGRPGEEAAYRPSGQQ